LNKTVREMLAKVDKKGIKVFNGKS